MFCPKCGSANDDGASFCAKCGATLAPAAAGAGASPTGGTMRTAAPPSGKLVTGKSPTVALVLSIFLGYFGVGQFYNGDWKKGLAMLVGTLVLGPPTGGLVALGIWIWSAIDAHQVASGTWKAW